MTLATNLLILATEDGVLPSHIGAKIALPLGLLFFCGSVYLLLWAIYGARKGALIYMTSFFAFNMVLGVFWWFGAPGTVVATGLRNFPGQAGDAYSGQWYGFEAGSDRADYFPDVSAFEDFQTSFEYVGLEPGADTSGNETFDFIQGDMDQASSKMMAIYLPTDATGGLRLGAQRRGAIEAFAAENLDAVVDEMVQPLTIVNAEGEEEQVPGAVDSTIDPASPFLTVRVAEEADGTLARRVTDANGHRVSAARLEIVANYIGANPDQRPIRGELVVESDTLFAFKDPGALWFPSAVWTFISLFGFAVFGYLLDAMEQREKRKTGEQVEEPMDVTVGASV